MQITDSRLRTTLILSAWLVVASTAWSQDTSVPDLDALLRNRDPETMIQGLKEGMQEKVVPQWQELVIDASELAINRNQESLYPNPILQAYINRLGQSLIPSATSENTHLSFRIVNDPLPYADALPTGAVYVSTGLLSMLDNESQLAFLLMHEAAHVILSHELQQIITEEKAEKRAKRMAVVGSAASLLAGKAVGGKTGGEIATYGTAASFLGAKIKGSFRQRRYLLELQKESDLFATEVLLQNGFDPRESTILLAKVGKIVSQSHATVGIAFGAGPDLGKRSTWIEFLLGGLYNSTINHVLDGEGFQVASPRFSELMAEVKRDNGLLALQQDLFVLAKTNLEESAAVRTDDPVTMFGLGQLYRSIGRSAADRETASRYLRAAMDYDGVRHRFPESFLSYAVELLSYEDPQYYPEVQAALKNYVALYQRKTGGQLPPEIRFVYDYLDRTGDSQFVAFQVNNISTKAPYQLTGNPEIDNRDPVEVVP